MFLQNSAGEKEINWVIIIGSLVLLAIGTLCVLIIPIISKYYPGEYCQVGQGGGKDVNSWLDEKVMAKLLKLLDKFELEKKLGSKKNQRLLETVDKSERKKAISALFYLVATLLPGYMVALVFDRIYKNIKRIITAKVVLVKCYKNSMMKSVDKILKDISRTKSLLWKILSI